MSVLPQATLAYSKAASLFHWAAAFPIVGCVATVMIAQNGPKEERGTWMFRHKSLGLLSGLIIAPRLAYRIVSRASAYNVKNLQGNAPWENVAGDASHIALYGFMVIMPVTGIAMGYYGGKGLPFFYTTYAARADGIPLDGKIAKQTYDVHKLVGTYGKFLVPLHVGAAFFHQVRGQAIFARLNPFRGPARA
jgi:cytochrome b561